jgi:hypothetical protein
MVSWYQGHGSLASIALGDSQAATGILSTHSRPVDHMAAAY